MRKLLCTLALLLAVAVVAGSPAKAAGSVAGGATSAGVICPNHPPCRPNQVSCMRGGCSFCCNILL